MPATAPSSACCCATSAAARRRCIARAGSRSELGRPIYLKREDLNHTGSHKLNNALGQALLARRMGKRRIIAETGAGQHGVATATVCALLGLECVVYMGVEDMRRQRPNVQRMELLGASVQPVDAGAKTLKEATSAAIRDWVTNVQSTHYVIGSAVGPAPYPALVRDLQRVIGDEARAQLLDAEGRLPARVVACVGGGSNAIGTFAAFIGDEGVELVGVEAGGEGIDTPRHGAPLTVGGRAGILHGSRSAVLQDEEGQIVEAHSISAGLDYPGAGPQHAFLRDSGRARYVAVTDTQALDAFSASRGPRASSRRSRPRTRSPGCSRRTTASSTSSASPAAATRTSPRCSAAHEHAGRDRRAADRRRVRERVGTCRADAVPDGRLSDARAVAGDRRGVCARRRRPARARRAIHRPARRRPGDPRGGHARARRRSERRRRARGRARARAERAGRADVLREHGLAPGVDAFVERLARTGACGLIVPDLPYEEAGEVLAACEAHGVALVPLVAPTTPPERLRAIGARARGFLYTVSVVGTTGERTALQDSFAEVIVRAKACTEVPVALGFGISTPEHARQAADAGADGVIVGTRLVRAAGEGEDPAGAVGAVVAELAAGLA